MLKVFVQPFQLFFLGLLENVIKKSIRAILFVVYTNFGMKFGKTISIHGEIDTKLLCTFNQVIQS